MIGDLHFFPKTLFAFRKRQIHFFQIREDQFPGLAARNSCWFNPLRRFPAIRDVAECQDAELCGAMPQSWRSGERTSFSQHFLKEARGRAEEIGRASCREWV